MTNKLIPISGLALALALATGFMRLSGAVASQRRTTPQYAPSQEARVLGILDEGANDAVVAPATVLAGEDFKVTITTIGSGCEREADTGVIVAEDGATVMVYEGMGEVLRCPSCDTVLLRLSRIRGETRLDMRGVRVLRWRSAA